MGTTLITPAWLSSPTGGDSGDAAHGWLLQKAGEVYELATDVTAQATAFIFGAAGITLDLKGHTVTYNDAPALTLTNPDFEVDAIGSTTVTGWDLAGAAASSFQVVANDCFLFGSRVLRWTVPTIPATVATGNNAVLTSANHGLSSGDRVVIDNFGTTPPIEGPRVVTVLDANRFSIPVAVTAVSDSLGDWCRRQSIRSANVAIPEANRTYSASISATRINQGGARGQSMRLEVFDAVTKLEVANYIRRDGNVGQGEAGTVTFRPTTTNPVYFEVVHQPATGPGPSSCAIDRFRVTRSCDYGIIACEGSAASMNGGTGTTAAAGSGVQGVSNLAAAAAVKFNKGHDVTIKDSTTARATAAIDGSGNLAGVTIDSAGSGYATPPRVWFAGGGANDGVTILPARGTAVLGVGGVVASITIDDPGGPYLIAPEVTIEPRGSVVQGAAGGAYCNPLQCHEQKGTLTVDGIRTYSTGDDVHAIRASFSGAAPGGLRRVARCVTEHPATGTNVTIRGNQIAEFYVAGGGPVEVGPCVMLNAAHSGVRMGSYMDGGEHHAHGIFASPNVCITNGYTAKLSGSNIRMLNWTIGRWVGTTFGPAESARGWLDEPDANLTSDSVEVAYVTADVYEKGNREYGIAGTPTRCMRHRNLATNALVSGRHYHHVSATARTRAGGGVNVKAYAARFNLQNWGGANPPARMLVEDCLLRAVIEGATDPGEEWGASSVVIDNLGGGLGPLFLRCRFETSDVAVQLSGSDASSAAQVRDATFRYSTYVKLTTGFTGRPLLSHMAGYVGTDVTNCNFYGNTYVNGTFGIAFAKASPKTIGLGEVLTVQAVSDAEPAGVAGAAVALADAAAAAAGSGTTDASGLKTMDVLTRLYTGTTTPVLTAKAPHTLDVTKAGYPGAHDIPLNLTLSPTIAVVNIGTGVATPTGAVQFLASNFMATTGGAFPVVVTRQGSTVGAATVHYATSNGTAAAGTDYTAASGDLAFADGDAMETFLVTVLALPTGSGDRTVNLTLTAPDGATLGTPATATLTLVDQGTPPPAQPGYVVIPTGGAAVILRMGGA